MSIVNAAKVGLNYAGRLIFDEKLATGITHSIKQYRHYNKAMKAAGKQTISIKNMIADSFKRAGAKATKANPNLWQSFKSSITSYGSEVAKLWKASDKGIFSKLGGTLKGLGKRMPLIGAALMVAFEIPNIFRATRDGGILNGALETVKSGARIATGIAAGAVLSGFLGPIGLIGGFMVGDWLAKLVVGKSHTEKLDEAQARQQELQQQQLAQFGAQFDPAKYRF